MTLALVMLLVVAHESGHWTAGRLFGLDARFGYRLLPFPYLVVRMPATSPGRTALIAAAGPIVNLAAAWPLWAIGQPVAAVVSFVVGAVSLAPVGAQDGAHILHAWDAR